MEDSSKETPSFASKEALENSSKEIAMASMGTATASMEAPNSSSGEQASKQASKRAERTLQKVLVVDTKTPAPHSQEQGVHDIEKEHSGTVAHATGIGASDHINPNSLPNDYTDYGAAEAGGALDDALLHNVIEAGGALDGALLRNGHASLHDVVEAAGALGGALPHNVGTPLGQEASGASLREDDNFPALEGHFGGSLDIDSKDQHIEEEAEELQGTCPEQPGVVHHEQDRQMVMMLKKLSKEQKQLQNADKIENDLGRYRILCEKREAEIAEAENRRKENKLAETREDFAEEYADRALQIGMSIKEKQDEGWKRNGKEYSIHVRRKQLVVAWRYLEMKCLDRDGNIKSKTIIQAREAPLFFAMAEKCGARLDIGADVTSGCIMVRISNPNVEKAPRRNGVENTQEL